MPMPKRSLEGKTLDYWILQMHWNGRQEELAKYDPFLTPLTVQDAIKGCNDIMTDLDPARPLSQRAFNFQSEIINRPDKPALPKVKHPQDLVGMKIKVQVKDLSA